MSSNVETVRRGPAAKRAKRDAAPKLLPDSLFAGLARPTESKRRKYTSAKASGPVVYTPHKDRIKIFVTRIANATPMELVDTELKGVDGMFVRDLTKRMSIPAVRMYSILGVPKATAEKKIAGREVISGVGGRAALGLARLLAMAEEIVANSKAAEAKDFDTAKWLGQWIERPQSALGGRKPADLISTPTGLSMVERVLGAIESGAYQ